MGAEDGAKPPLDPTSVVGKDAADHRAAWLSGLQKNFGLKFLVITFCIQHLTKGFVKWLTDSGEKFVLESYAVSASQMAVYQGVIRIPWASKPVFGMISDLIPVAGYTRGPYIIMTTILAVGALCALGFGQTNIPVVGTVLLMMVLNFHVSFSDLMMEAVYAKQIRERPAEGPDLISFIWGGLFVCGCVGTALSGTIIDSSGPFTLYLVALVPTAVLIIPTAANYLGESKLSTEEVSAARRRIFAQAECVFLCVIMFIATLSLTLTGILITNKKIVFIISLVVAVIVFACFSLLLSPVIAKVNAFGMIQTILALRYGTAQFFFFTDAEDVYPEGPHFSNQFVATVLPLVGSAFAVLGIYLYRTYMQNLTYTYIYIAGNCIAFFAFLTDTMFYLHWNRPLGIPDKVFALGSMALEEVIHSFLWMPGCVMMSHLCPKGLEAIMFALLASCHNLGAIISMNFGAFVLEMLGCDPTGKAQDADGHPRTDTASLENLWIVSLIATCLPMLSIVLVPWFIPARKQNENLVDGGDGDLPATAGSLYEQWYGVPERRVREFGDTDDEERQSLVGTPRDPALRQRLSVERVPAQ
jgi:hypothetical protein